jgi:hypothetical protein
MKFQFIHVLMVAGWFNFTACQTDSQTTNAFALTPSITVIADTTIKITMRFVKQVGVMGIAYRDALSRRPKRH